MSTRFQSILHGGTAAEVWEHSVNLILKHGEVVPTEKGVSALEVTNIQLVVENVLKEPRISNNYPFGADFVEGWKREFHLNKGPFAVNSRIFEYGEARQNQLEDVKKRLRRNWHSRRAIVSTWDPKLDGASAHPPCPLILQFAVRNERLLLTSILRSNDAWKGAPVDILCLEDIQIQLAKELGIEPGHYTHIALDYHIYESDLALVYERFGDPT